MRQRYFRPSKPGHRRPYCTKGASLRETPGSHPGREARAPPPSSNDRLVARSSEFGATDDGISRATVSNEPGARRPERNGLPEARLSVAIDRFSDALKRHGNILRGIECETAGTEEKSKP